MWDWAYFGQQGYYGIAWLGYDQLLLSTINCPGFGWYPGYDSVRNLVAITKDQLKKPTTSPYKVPDKLKDAIRSASKAVEQGDKRALESMRAVPSQRLFVEGKHMDSPDISKRALRSKDITQPAKSWNGDLKPLSDPYRAAVQAHWDAAGAAALSRYMFGDNGDRIRTDHFKAWEISEKAGAGRSFRGTNQTNPSASVAERTFSNEINSTRTFGSRSSSMRARDWNPDIKYARMAGVSIVYSSKSNEIKCPELKLSSRSTTNSRIKHNSGTSGSISRGLSTFLSSSGGSSGGSGSSGSSSRGSTSSSSRGASSGGGSRGSSGSKK